MGHVVVHRDARGQLQLEEASSLDDALARVEALRNADDHDDVRVFEEVPLEVKTYYRVAVASAPSAPDRPTAAAPASAPPAAAPASAPPAAARPVAVPDAPPAAAEPEVAGDPADGHGADRPTAPGRVGADGPSDADLTAMLSPFDDGSSVADAPRSPAAGPPPGTFPLAGPPVPHAEPSTADEPGDTEAPSLAGRRGPRFSRER